VSTETVPQSLQIPLSAAIGLAVEHWRLTHALAAGQSAASSGAARHALRKMEDFLALCELTIQHLDGHPFDAGLAVRVVDTIDDPKLAKGTIIIDETVSPLVMWRGVVVKSADVVTRNGTLA
jgi:hypothetical protein